MWSIYGKVLQVVKETADKKVTISYQYDATGNRVFKRVLSEPNSLLPVAVKNSITAYWRDAQGNVLKTETKGDAMDTQGIRTSLNQQEFVIYGSSRLGTYSPVYNQFVNQFFGITKNTLTLGYKNYELSNHLGNVLTTISDNYAPQPPTGGVSARVLSSQDYFPFGMVMTERSFVEKQDRKYRFGFNTQERDEDINSEHYTAEFWEYDGRTGRRWNIDPVVKVFESPYACLGNSPIWMSDVLGNDTLRMNIKRVWEEKRAVVYKVTFTIIQKGVEKMTTYSKNLYLGQENESFYSYHTLGYTAENSESKLFNMSFDKMSNNNWKNTLRVVRGVFIHKGPIVDKTWSKGCFIPMNELDSRYDDQFLAPPPSEPFESYEEEQQARKNHSQNALNSIKNLYDQYKAENKNGSFRFQLKTNSTAMKNIDYNETIEKNAENSQDTQLNEI